jgi:hypothetical protein
MLILGRFDDSKTALGRVQVILENIGENFLPTSETFGEIIRIMVEVEDWEGVLSLAE